ncbi:RHS repeat-associated core domain-containing protein, partial [Micromonospora rifamycinica]
NMATRSAGQGNQTLSWDDTGELTAVTGGTDGDSSFLYDADGNLLIQKDPGSSTLYLPGQQITLNTTQTLSGVRYHPLPNGATAIRTGTGTSYGYTIPDHQGTPGLYLNNTAQVPTWRQYTPYGAPRGATVTTPDNRGFLNQPLNTNTGLTQVGARNYDPDLGRFISLDPLQDLADPQQWNGYAYANNSPVTTSDPSGLIPADCREFDCYGYSPTKGCPGGCGTPENQRWGRRNGRKGTAPTRRNDPRILGHVIRVPVTVPLEEFTRRWNEQRGEWFGREFTSDDILQAQDERRLAMNICHEMGRPGGCQQWIEELYNPYIDSLAATLPSDDLIPGGVGGLGAAGAVGRGGSRPSVGGGGCKSFSGDTNVLMADGSAKRLDEVRPGDEVLAADPESGIQGPRRVEHVWIHPDELIDLEVGGALLTTTEDHPFWNHTDRQWQRADQLDPGDLVLSPDGLHPVGGLLPSSTQTALAYNLTVNSIHTYYVIVGNTPVLVHNSSGLCGAQALESGDWQHIVDRHRPGGALVTGDAGIFSGKAKLVRARIAETVNRGVPRSNSPDPATGAPRPGQVYEWDFGTPVGRAGPNNGGGELRRESALLWTAARL